MAKPWRWGETDCCMFAGDWVRLATGHDPLSRYRGKYATALEARRLIAEAGGLAAIVGAELEALGFVRTETPRDGDVGIVEGIVAGNAGGERAELLAIHHGTRWVMRTGRGLAAAPGNSLVAWAINA